MYSVWWVDASNGNAVHFSESHILQQCHGLTRLMLWRKSLLIDHKLAIGRHHSQEAMLIFPSQPSGGVSDVCS
jgi:hypothetical protein